MTLKGFQVTFTLVVHFKCSLLNSDNVLQPIIAKLLQLRPIRSQISLIVYSWEVRWPRGQCARPRIEQSWLEHWPRTFRNRDQLRSEIGLFGSYADFAYTLPTPLCHAFHQLHGLILSSFLQSLFAIVFGWGLTWSFYQRHVILQYSIILRYSHRKYFVRACSLVSKITLSGLMISALGSRSTGPSSDFRWFIVFLFYLEQNTRPPAMETNHLIDTHYLEPNNKKTTTTKERSIGKKKKTVNKNNV